MTNEDRDPDDAQGRFSLHRLSAAFARLTGSEEQENQGTDIDRSLQEFSEPIPSTSINEVLSPRMIVEGMLFVGNDEGKPYSNREMAANIRDVSPKEVDELIQELNQLYHSNETPYEIVSEGAGYRMQIRPTYEPLRQRFYGRLKEAKLTTQAIEVLSIVAYRQPINAEDVNKLRASQSRSLLNQLVRRGLLEVDRPDKSPKIPTYQTTARFNELFRIGSPQDLPQSEDLDDN